MKYYAGLDVSTEETAVCVIDGEGTVVAKAKVASTPAALAGYPAPWSGSPVRGVRDDEVRRRLMTAPSSVGPPPKRRPHDPKTEIETTVFSQPPRGGRAKGVRGGRNGYDDDRLVAAFAQTTFPGWSCPIPTPSGGSLAPTANGSAEPHGSHFMLAPDYRSLSTHEGRGALESAPELMRGSLRGV